MWFNLQQGWKIIVTVGDYSNDSSTEILNGSPF